MESDKNVWSYEFEKDKEMKAGQLLLSEPFMFDENFRRTVVLVCEHNSETGTVGLILNKPINLRMRDVLEDFPVFSTKLYMGGPVGTDTLQFLHSLGNHIENSIQLTENLYWGGNFEQLKERIRSGEVQVEEVRFFLGYSGWSYQQLNEELKGNSWIVTQSKSKFIFHTQPDTLWKEIMVGLGGIYNTMASYPENPTLN